nr:hypothetical protein [uncultured Chryseobacterium sp.]
MKSIHRYLFITGGLLSFLSIIMFFIAVGMFTARGDYPSFIIKLCELFFILWLPSLIIGILLILSGIGIYFAKISK